MPPEKITKLQEFLHEWEKAPTRESKRLCLKRIAQLIKSREFLREYSALKKTESKKLRDDGKHIWERTADERFK